MNEQIQEILEKNIERGSNAEKAYNLYVKDFIAQAKSNIHTAFEDLSMEDVAGLHKLKIMHSGILALEQSILLDIETRDLASRQLEAEASNAETTH